MALADKKIAIVGTGYVGLVSGTCFAEIGNYVTCLDQDNEKIKSLTNGVVPIYEKHLPELIEKNVNCGRLSFSSQIDKVLIESNIIIIAVGTPDKPDGSADLSYVFSAVEQIANILKSYSNNHKLIIVKSTVPPGTNREIYNIVKDLSGSNNFDLVFNPEFLREGSAINDFMNPDRIVIGLQGSSTLVVDIISNIYANLPKKVDFIFTDFESAEVIKYASNSYLALRIAFINEIATYATAIGANITDVVKAVGMDKRIGSNYFTPGPGFGGSCFPKDIRALMNNSAKKSVELPIINSIITSNNKRFEDIVYQIEKVMNGNLSGKIIAVFGITFKANTDDIRDSPSLAIISLLLRKGAIIKTYDIMRSTTDDQHKNLQYCSKPEDAAENAEGIIIATEWQEFKNLNYTSLFKAMKGDKIIIDLRSILEEKAILDIGFRFARL